MYQMKKFPYNYIPEIGLQILELPYVDEELSMFILLPEETENGSDPLLMVHNLKKQLPQKKKQLSRTEQSFMKDLTVVLSSFS